MEGCLIVTYRCNAKCYMCNIWKNPTKIRDEFTPNLVEKIPDNLKFLNITGGEPFLRDDLEEIVARVLTKTKRVVISSNGYFTEKILRLFQRFKREPVGIRISIEGLPAANDALRGIKNGFDHGLRTLTALHSMGVRDIGFGITVSDRNADDLIELFRLANAMGLEFATAVTHNSFYFHTMNNQLHNPEKISRAFESIAVELLKTIRPKNWFRAYFNMGLAGKVLDKARPLPCEVGTDMFFVDPAGNLLPCNGSAHPMIMGNLHAQSFEEIWHSPQAEAVRQQVRQCDRQCWMIGSAAPAMKKQIINPLHWIIKNKLLLLRSSSCKNIKLLPV